MVLSIINHNGNKSRVKFHKNLIVLTSSNIHRLHRFRKTISDQAEHCYILWECEDNVIPLSKGKIDCIDNGFMQTSLSIEDYLSFYGIANGVYGDLYVKAIEEFIVKNDLQEYCEEPICNLDLKHQLLVRLFITAQKNAQVVLIDNAEGAIHDSELCCIIRTMQELSRQMNFYCIVTTQISPMIIRYKGERYNL